MATELEVSTSPRSTWVWARDADEAEGLRALLLAADCSVASATGRNAESRVLDIDIGYEAGAALQVLADAGHTFWWHSSQYVLNRRETVLGFPIVDPEQLAAQLAENGPERLEQLDAADRFDAEWDADPDGTDVPGSPGLQRPR